MNAVLRSVTTRNSGAGNGYFTVRCELDTEAAVAGITERTFVTWDGKVVGKVIRCVDGVMTLRCEPLSYTADFRRLLDGGYVADGDLTVDETGVLTSVAL